MALQEYALTLVTTVEDELGIQAGSETARFERYIHQASRQIATYLRRTLERASAVAERLAGDGSPYLLLGRPPLRSITSVTLDGATVDASSYSIDDADAGVLFRELGWTWSGFARPGADQGRDIFAQKKNYLVTYDGGWMTPRQVESGRTFDGETADLPADIEGACIELVRYLRARRGADHAQYSDDGAVQSGLPLAMPPSVMATLKPYKHVVIE